MTDPVRRSQFMRAFHGLVIAIIVLYLGLAALGTLGFFDSRTKASEAQRQAAASHDLLVENRRALQYLCSTTTVLDDLVKTAAAQTQANIDNGVYDKLLKRGILTAKNVANAHDTLDRYNDAHDKLQQKRPCNTVKNETRK